MGGINPVDNNKICSLLSTFFSKEKLRCHRCGSENYTEEYEDFDRHEHWVCICHDCGHSSINIHMKRERPVSPDTSRYIDQLLYSKSV